MGSIPSGAQLIVVCDVETRFKDAARDFGPQKGASPKQVAELTERLEDLEAEYRDRFGVNIGGGLRRSRIRHPDSGPQPCGDGGPGGRDGRNDFGGSRSCHSCHHRPT
ncbi:glycerate kinase [Arthrobacter sp. NPDC057013]|uniref:glycerate kinase n=1 Tax=Arthrobacter sp. NPDC057013 TaxID=3345999 RepID=UPI00363C599B